MDTNEKRKKLDKFCDLHRNCYSDDCPLRGETCRCGRGAHFMVDLGDCGYMTNEEIDAAYDLAFTSEATEPEPAEHDNVNRPSHYTAGKIECIDAMESAVTGLEGMAAVLTAQVVKYMWRWKKKNGVEDLRKAQWYLNRLIEMEMED